LKAPPARDGYRFGGWYDNGRFTGNPITEIPRGSSTGDKTFHAKWDKIPYDIIYMPDDEEIDYGDNPATYTVEDEVTLQDPPERKGYHFAGWHNDGLFNSPVSSPAISKGDTERKTFYAKWDPGVSVQITLRLQPEDPPLSNESIFVDGEANFSAAGTGYTSWQWYWNGTLIPGARADTYALADDLKSVGAHELSVEARTGRGQIFSARCRVAIKARKGGA
jgi:uncharacterized repeat protein (TIGR02543 family)